MRLRTQRSSTTLHRDEKKCVYGLVLAAQLLCVAVALIATFTPPPVGLLRSDGTLLCPRRTVCADNIWSTLLLAVARLSAAVMYPALVVIFLTKCHALRTRADRSPLAIRLPLNNLHKLHAAMGKVIVYCTIVHAAAHLARWGIQGDYPGMLAHLTVVSGFVATLALPLIVLPMACGALRRRLSFEVRKGLHTSFALVFGVALCLHATKTPLGVVVGAALCVYGLDALYCFFALTYKIDATTFRRLATCVQLSFDNPRGWNDEVVGYALVNVPWIAQDEWHPFSLYPSSATTSSACIQVAGDWTAALHAEVALHATTRACYVCGPFASPFATATSFDDIILVASGIGITSAIDLLAREKATRRINLLWICRDPSLVEFVLETVAFDDDAYTLVFYTGSRRLVFDGAALPPCVLIFYERPELARVIRCLIHAIETESGLPGGLVDEALRLCRQNSVDGSSKARDGPAALRIAVTRALASSGPEAVQAHFFNGADRLTAAHLRAGAELFGATLSHHAAESLVWDLNGNDFNATSVTPDQFREYLDDVAAKLRLPDTRVTAFGRARQPRLAEMHKVPSSTTSLGAIATRDDATAMFQAAASDDVVSPRSFLRDCGRDLDHWEILYCGGSKSISKMLAALTSEYGIVYRNESYGAW